MLASDLLVGAGLSGLQSKAHIKEWRPLFSSREFLHNHKEVTIEAFELSRESQCDLGVKISEARATLLDAAKVAHDANNSDMEASQQYVSRLEKKIL